MTRGVTAVVVGAFALHAIQSLLVPSPWLLPDEMHASDAARDTVRSGFPSLWAVLTWPLWALGTEFGYAAAKLLGSAAVAAAALPAYALARLFVAERVALVVAAVSVLAPATVFASTAHPGAVAYPFAVAATYFVLVRRDALAGAFAVVAGALWPPLVLALIVAVTFVFVRRVGVRAVREWPAAAIVIVVPAALYASLVAGRLSSDAFRRATDRWEDVPLAAGASLGALALGLALVPFVVALAGVVGRDDDRHGELVGLVAVATVALALVAGLMALGRGDARTGDELALLPMLPSLLTLAADTLRRIERRALAVAALATAAFVLLLGTTDDRHAPGVALADELGLGATGYAVALILLGANVLVVLRLLGRFALAPVALAIAALALVVPAEVVAWASNRDAPDVRDEIERVADGRRITVLGADTPLHTLYTLLFWTPSAALADPPLDARELDARTGGYEPPLPGRLVFDSGNAGLAGVAILRTPVGVLLDVGAAGRAAETIEGLYGDKWSTGDAYYRRFAGEQVPGVVLVTVSRAAWRGPSKRAQVVLTATPIGGEPFAERITSIDSGEERLVRVPVPPPPFELKVAIGPTFSPSDYGRRDPRQLGAQLTFDYRPGA